MKDPWSLPSVFCQAGIQGGPKKRSERDLFLVSLDREVIAINRMHSNDVKECGTKCGYFWFHSDVFLDEINLAYFNANIFAAKD